MKHGIQRNAVATSLMKAWKVACMLAFSGLCAYGQPSIDFVNNSSCPITYGATGQSVRIEDGYEAALFYAPLGVSYSGFVQSGSAVPLGKPVAGIFAGGTRLTDAGVVPGDSVQVQVRAWPAMFPTYNDAVFNGAAVGVSTILVVKTGDAGAQPALPPPSLTVAGFQGFTISSQRNSSATAVSGLSITCVDGHTMISFAGTAGQNYVIQSAPALTGPWFNVSTTSCMESSGTMQYSDEQSSAATRFYRVLVQQ